ncbi:MAG TPA: PAS domain-containing protein, partial [Acidimicrobiales bacterium]|nr:PAS domain-containing protein [Acidimicrobiales bacterium]
MSFSELPRRSRLIIAATVLGGVAATALVGVTSVSTPRMSPVLWLIVGVVFVVDLFTWVRPLVLYRSNHSEAFHFDEGFLVVLTLLVPPAVTMAVFGGVVILSQIIRRRPFVKSAFNFGEVMLGAGLAVSAARAIGVPHQPLGVMPVLGACAGAVIYFLVSTTLVSSLMVSMGAAWRECVSADMTAQLAVSATGALVGALLAIDIHIDRWATALAVPLLVAVRLLVSAQFKAQHDRARMQGLFNVTLDANRRLSHDAVIDSVLQAARDHLRCPTASLTVTEPRPGDMAAAIDIGTKRQWLTVSGRRREEPFDQADRMLLDAIAAIAKGALTNAELYRQVRYERGRLASVTLNIGEGVIAVDADGNLTFVNPAAADLIRLPTRNIPI